MSTPVDPPRLRSGSALGELLDEARREELDEATRARAWRSIELAAASTAVGAGAVKSGTLLGKLGAFTLSKIGVTVLLVVLALLGGVLAVVAGRAPAPTTTSAAPSPPEAHVAPSPVETLPLATPSAPSADPPPAPTPSTSTTTAAAAPAVPSPSTAKGAVTLEEGRLLLEAKAAIGSDPRRSIALTTEHAKAFPTSALGAERESIAIDALARLGRCNEVRARARRFLAVFRQSPHRGLVERLEAGCGG